MSRLEFAIETAMLAGRVTLEHFGETIEVEQKADDSPVTVADRRAERLIRERIEQYFPGEAILGEEEGETGDGDTRWVIDPIDGTKSFIAGVPLYATLLSYEEKGLPLVGVANLPALDELYAAERGRGVTRNVEPCKVSQRATLGESTIAMGSLRSTQDQGRLEGMLTLARLSPAVRGWGDAYGHLLVASGRIEAMIDPIVAPWDISAIEVIVEEAGGRFTDFSGRPGLHRDAISSNDLVHDAILDVFR